MLCVSRLLAGAVLAHLGARSSPLWHSSFLPWLCPDEQVHAQSHASANHLGYGLPPCRGFRANPKPCSHLAPVTQRASRHSCTRSPHLLCSGGCTQHKMFKPEPRAGFRALRSRACRC